MGSAFSSGYAGKKENNESAPLSARQRLEESAPLLARRSTDSSSRCRAESGADSTSRCHVESGANTSSRCCAGSSTDSLRHCRGESEAGSSSRCRIESGTDSFAWPRAARIPRADVWPGAARTLRRVGTITGPSSSPPTWTPLTYLQSRTPDSRPLCRRRAVHGWLLPQAGRDRSVRPRLAQLILFSQESEFIQN